MSEVDRPGIFRDNVAPDGSGGTIINLTLKCRRLYAGDPHVSKAWRYVDVLAAARRLAVDDGHVLRVRTRCPDAHQLAPSNIGTWGFGTWGTGTWGAANQVSYEEPMAGTGYFQDVTITDAGEALPVFSQVTRARLPARPPVRNLK